MIFILLKFRTVTKRGFFVSDLNNSKLPPDLKERKSYDEAKQVIVGGLKETGIEANKNGLPPDDHLSYDY